MPLFSPSMHNGLDRALGRLEALVLLLTRPIGGRIVALVVLITRQISKPVFETAEERQRRDGQGQATAAQVDRPACKMHALEHKAVQAKGEDSILEREGRLVRRETDQGDELGDKHQSQSGTDLDARPQRALEGLER